MLRSRALASFAILIVIAMMIGACKKKKAEITPASETIAATMIVSDASDNLIFTWIDDKGDFHVEDKAINVPLMGRDTVRVVDTTKDSADGDQVIVADMRSARADGTYAVHVMARSAFDQIALERRQKNGPTLVAPPTPSGASPNANGTNATGANANAMNANGASSANPTRASIIIYGASWCSACHDAAAYLRRKGIAFVEKDIEEDQDAAREMNAKLQKNGLRAGSIPVIDVHGKVMVGFSAPAIDAALGKAI
jgi:glutaredoxin